jgi:hypothetical protein
MTEAEREKIKIRAAYLNGLSLIFFGIGGFGPAFAILSSHDGRSIFVALVWLWAGGMSSWELHKMAQRHLDKLPDPS